MITIRKELPADKEAIHHLHESAFETSFEANLVASLRKTNFYLKELSLVAECEGAVVGHILFTRIAIKDGKSTHPALALAPLAVHPAMQHKGIGKMLIEKGLETCKYLGNHLVIVLGDPKYYAKFNFELASAYDIYPPQGMPEEHFMLYKFTSEDLKEKGTVQYPSQFSHSTF